VVVFGPVGVLRGVTNAVEQLVVPDIGVALGHTVKDCETSKSLDAFLTSDRVQHVLVASKQQVSFRIPAFLMSSLLPSADSILDKVRLASYQDHNNSPVALIVKAATNDIISAQISEVRDKFTLLGFVVAGTVLTIVIIMDRSAARAVAVMNAKVLAAKEYQQNQISNAKALLKETQARGAEASRFVQNKYTTAIQTKKTDAKQEAVGIDADQQRDTIATGDNTGYTQRKKRMQDKMQDTREKMKVLWNKKKQQRAVATEDAGNKDSKASTDEQRDTPQK
jgi:hypothetical protein